MKTKSYVGKYTQTIQEYLFTMGFTWSDGSRDPKEEAPTLYIIWDEKTLYYGYSLEIFLDDASDELSFGELIKKIKELKAEKEVCKYKPFDKILVRDSETHNWRPALFNYYEEGTPCPYICVAPHSRYKQAIPYKGNEHLANKKG